MPSGRASARADQRPFVGVVICSHPPLKPTSKKFGTTPAERWDVDQAEEYLRGLQHAIERAAANPRVGRSCDEVAQAIASSPQDRTPSTTASAPTAPSTSYGCCISGWTWTDTSDLSCHVFDLHVLRGGRCRADNISCWPFVSIRITPNSSGFSCRSSSRSPCNPIPSSPKRNS